MKLCQNCEIGILVLLKNFPYYLVKTQKTLSHSIAHSINQTKFRNFSNHPFVSLLTPTCMFSTSSMASCHSQQIPATLCTALHCERTAPFRRQLAKWRQLFAPNRRQTFTRVCPWKTTPQWSRRPLLACQTTASAISSNSRRPPSICW